MEFRLYTTKVNIHPEHKKLQRKINTKPASMFGRLVRSSAWKRNKAHYTAPGAHTGRTQTEWRKTPSH